METYSPTPPPSQWWECFHAPLPVSGPCKGGRGREERRGRRRGLPITSLTPSFVGGFHLFMFGRPQGRGLWTTPHKAQATPAASQAHPDLLNQLLPFCKAPRRCCTKSEERGSISASGPACYHWPDHNTPPHHTPAVPLTLCGWRWSVSLTVWKGSLAAARVQTARLPLTCT